MRDTIFALATGSGRSAVAIVRVSGPLARDMLVRLCGAAPPARQATLTRIIDSDGAMIDRGLALWFPGPASFTGEDVFELQVHGGVAVVSALSRALAGLGARPADPGEFTRRAFEAGRLDLAQAEAVADLVDAETETQRRQALAQFDGATTTRIATWRRTLLEALAFLEVQIDFADEDIPEGVAEQARAPLVRLQQEIDAALASAQGERVRNGLKIALIGAPNAGKSSLLNALVDRDAAIVTETPGTTRDVIEIPLMIAGHKALLADTAGLRETQDPIEAEGVRRAKVWAERADLRLWLVEPDESGGRYLQRPDVIQSGDIAVLTKSDKQKGVSTPPADLETVKTSTLTPTGISELQRRLADWVTTQMAGAEFPVITQARHRLLLQDASDHLKRGLGRLSEAELCAEDVRLAARALEKLAGRINTEDVLDLVFGSFCIGK